MTPLYVSTYAHSRYYIYVSMYVSLLCIYYNRYSSSVDTQTHIIYTHKQIEGIAKIFSEYDVAVSFQFPYTENLKGGYPKRHDTQV